MERDVSGEQQPTLAASYRYDPFGTNQPERQFGRRERVSFFEQEIHVNSGMYYYGYRW